MRCVLMKSRQEPKLRSDKQNRSEEVRMLAQNSPIEDRSRVSQADLQASLQRTRTPCPTRNNRRRRGCRLSEAAGAGHRWVQTGCTPSKWREYLMAIHITKFAVRAWSVSVLLIVVPSLSFGDTTGSALLEFGLEGHWSADCADPPSNTNPHIYIELHGRVSHNANTGCETNRSKVGSQASI